MKYTIKVALGIFIVLFLAAQMNYAQATKDTTHQHMMHHMRSDSTYHHMMNNGMMGDSNYPHMMKDSSKWHHMDSSKMMNHKMMNNSGMMNHNNMMNGKKSKMKKNPMIHTGVINLKMIDKNKDGEVYQDMMDWNVISDKPGTCPICGMKLKEVTVSQAKENLVKHGFKVK